MCQVLEAPGPSHLQTAGMGAANIPQKRLSPALITSQWGGLHLPPWEREPQMLRWCSTHHQDLLLSPDAALWCGQQDLSTQGWTHPCTHKSGVWGTCGVCACITARTQGGPFSPQLLPSNHLQGTLPLLSS